MPHELSVGDVYFSPLLSVIVLAFFAAAFTAMIANKLKIARYVYAPAYLFLAMMTLYAILIDKFWIKF